MPSTMSDPPILEKAPTASVSSNIIDFDDEATLPSPPELTLDQERKLYRRIDLRLMPILILMYIMAAMDGGMQHNISDCSH
jgi:MFS transporter, ACS family, DAL5 transporter family protein